jgi:hypothetical protein
MKPFVRAAAACALALLVTSTASNAFAYRPFEGTDAAVAELGEFELELGPVQYQRAGTEKFVMAPATVLNFGIANRWELVIDWRNFVKVSGASSTPPVHFEDTDVFLKTVLREGALQDKTGLSIATEFGPLLPNYRGEKGFGLADNVITSYQIPELTLHLNTALALSRAHQLDAFAGLILEGPHEWTVRPVTEVMVEREHGGPQTAAVLVGAIWEAREHLAIDGALRGSRVDGVPVQEVRLGLTWATGLWGGE